MKTILHIFDFDGTLFRNPQDTEKNRLKYEESTGLPWFIDKKMSRELSAKHKKHIGIRRGWYGRRETLEPPLVSDPAPAEWFIPQACSDFLVSKKREEVLTVLMTGRHAGIRHAVLRIMGDGKLLKVKRTLSKDNKLFVEIQEDVPCYFNGDKGPNEKAETPKGADTLTWKLWMFDQLLDVHQDIEEVCVWEDRDEHVVKFRELDNKYPQKFSVIHIR